MQTKPSLTALLIETTDGVFVARYSENGLAQLDFPSGKSRPAASAGEVPAQLQRWHKLTTRALSRALSGQPTGELPPLDVSGTAFQKRVWSALQKIGCGATRTYTQIAESVGTPNAARAVGSACGANSIPVLIPCHRVLATGGKLGGFSGGLDWKRKLLGREHSFAAC